MNLTAFCVYLTIYRGNKLPPFYIGSSSIKKINSGYKGSVSSEKYKDIWKKELKTNPSLFKTKIISKCATRQIAFNRENDIQHKLNVVKSSMYINGAYAKDMSYMTGSGKLNGMYGKKHSDETKLVISIKNKGKYRTHEQKLAIKEKRKKQGKKKYIRRDFNFKGSSCGTTLYTDPITTHSIRLSKDEFIPFGYEKGQLVEKSKTHSENMKDNIFYTDPLTNIVKRFKDLKDVPENWIRGNINSKADRSSLFGVFYIKNFITGEYLKVTDMDNLPKFHGHIHSKYAYVYNNTVTFSIEVFVKNNDKLNTSLIKKIYKCCKISKKAKTIHSFLLPYNDYSELGIKVIPINEFMDYPGFDNFRWLN